MSIYVPAIHFFHLQLKYLDFQNLYGNVSGNVSEGFLREMQVKGRRSRCLDYYCIYDN
jgi:hypothetical protein